MKLSRATKLAVLPLFLGAAIVGCGDDDLPVAPEPLPDIVDTAIGAEIFETLVAAVIAADLVETLRSPGPFTVFAPTDEAFAALPAGTVESLLLPENKDQLISILLYHVVADEVTSDEVLLSAELITVEGSPLQIDAVNNRVNQANLIQVDIEAENGVVHIIDSVLLPPAE